MRPSCSLFVKQGRKPAQEPFPFQELLPLKLKSTVSGKGDKTSDVACLHEMSILFACMKQQDFNQALCAKEIDLFQKCYKDSLDKKFFKKEQEREGTLLPGNKNLGHKQINQLLRRFPPL